MNKQALWVILAMLVQAAILAAVPARKVHTYLTGKSVVLALSSGVHNWAAPDCLRVSYDISRPLAPVVGCWPAEALRTVCSDPNRAALSKIPFGSIVYVVLKQNGGVWTAREIRQDIPASLPPDAVIIKGRKGYDQIEYDVEYYTISPAEGAKFLRDHQERPGDARMEIKVDRFGQAVVEKLLVQDRVYSY